MSFPSRFYNSHWELLGTVRQRDRAENKGSPTGNFFFSPQE